MIEKFISTFKSMYSQEEKDFFKVMNMLESYAWNCASLQPTPITSADDICFKNMIQGLATDTALSWQAVGTSICEKASSYLIEKGVFQNKTEFYVSLSEPFTKKVITRFDLKHIFDAIADAAKERFQELRAKSL